MLDAPSLGPWKTEITLISAQAMSLLVRLWSEKPDYGGKASNRKGRLTNTAFGKLTGQRVEEGFQESGQAGILDGKGSPSREAPKGLG